MTGWIVFLVIVVVALYWWYAAMAYETAYQRARQLCQKYQLIFLDDTLTNIQTRPCRHGNGYLQLCRKYQFEFSTHTADTRYLGWIWLQGQSVEKTEMQPYAIQKQE